MLFEVLGRVSVVLTGWLFRLRALLGLFRSGGRRLTLSRRRLDSEFRTKRSLDSELFTDTARSLDFLSFLWPTVSFLASSHETSAANMLITGRTPLSLERETFEVSTVRPDEPNQTEMSSVNTSCSEV